MIVKFLLAAVLATLLLQTPQNTPSRERLIGSWRLVSAQITTDKGEVRDSWGPNPSGFLTYTADGRMHAILTRSDRKPFSVADFISAPAAERAEAFAASTAYAGRFSVVGDHVIHHAEIATTPNDVGADMEREIVELSANRLVLRVAKPYLRGGIMVKSQDLVWERVQ